MDNPLLCFVHIPKTAGSSVRAALQQMVGPEKVYWIGMTEPEEAWYAAPSSHFADFLVVGGHAPASTFHRIDRPKVFATTVRDPLQRAASYFHFLTEVAIEHPLNASLRKIGFLGALTSSFFAPQFVNLQCEWIGGKPSIAAALTTLLREGWIIRRYDQLEDLTSEIAWRFRWPKPTVEKLNAAPAPYYNRVCTPKIERLLHKLNDEDRKLWALLS